jgi:uncharacterized protein DUF6326
MMTTPSVLEDVKVHVKLKLSALWASVMFCYIYGDYFGLFKPGTLPEMIAGKMGPLGLATQGVLLGVAIMMAIPGVMVFLSLVLPPTVNRWTNVTFGVIYTLIMLMTMPGEWAFYIFLGVVEAALTALVVWYAWSWPRLEGKIASVAGSSIAAQGAQDATARD